LPLQSGTRIGGYEIVALLGAGGMGEVYRARDSRLAREVAIKILSPNIAADADALMRFEREARALASLNHPNIAAIYGVEDNGAQPALILELVDGETLADRIAAGPIAVNDAIEIAKQIADALDVAHEAGIVYRDLKPGNIKITDDGRVKVLDFGLAKAIAIASGESPDLDPSNSPTVTVHGTHGNVILGTAAYMSPEQARGKRIDKRTDIWAFGCVLFEMLTGKRPFTGETTSDLIAAIIERAPDLSPLPRTTPAHVHRVIERCLEKDPKRRARDIADVRNDLDPREAEPTGSHSRSLAMPVTLAIITAVAAIAAVMIARPRQSEPVLNTTSTVEFAFGAPAGYTLIPARAMASPDGRSVAFVASDDKKVSAIFVRSLDTATARRIEGTDGVINAPTWSPDGRSIAYAVSGAWKRVAIDGGPPVTIVSNIQGNLGASWGPGDVFLLTPANRTSLARVTIGGGTLQPVTTLNTERENSHRWPQLLPDGRHFLFTVRSDSPDRLGIKLGSLDSSEIRSLVNVASQGIYAEPGWVLFVTPDRVLMAQRLDPATWTLQGTARPIAGPVRYNGPSFYGFFDVSIDGKMLVYSAASDAGSTLEWFDRTGKPLGRVGPERDYRSVRLSRDGRTITAELPDPQVGTRDIWLIDSATQLPTRFTTNPATDWRGVISPDGKSMVFASDRVGTSAVFRAAITNAGSETLLLRTPRMGAFPVDWSADGKYVFAAGDDLEARPRRLLKIPVDGGSPEEIVTGAQNSLIMPRVSPEGDRIAFTSAESGTPADLYVMSISDRRRVRVSTMGASNPVWGPNGSELFYQSSRGELMRAVLSGTSVSGSPQVMFRPCENIGRTYSPAVTEWNYDVSADGTRFLVICDSPDSIPSALNVIVNWQSKLK